MQINMLFQIFDSNNVIKHMMSGCPMSICETFELEEFDTGQFNLLQGEVYNDVYIIVSGQVAITVDSFDTDRKVPLSLYGSGDLIGEHEAIIGKPFSSSVENISPVKMLRISCANFLRWVEVDRHFSYLLLQGLANQMYDLSTRTKRFNLLNAQQQIIVAILDAAKQKRTISKTELSYKVATSGRNIDRVVKQLRDKQLISLNHAIIEILDYSGLEMYLDTES